MADPNDDQWHAKIRELAPSDTHGSRLSTQEIEAPARKWLANELRKLAAHIEDGTHYPMVYCCSVPKGGVQFEGTLVEYQVILSHLWGG